MGNPIALDLDGKVLLVTGAGGGIGSATARGAVEAGAQVVLHDLAAGGGAEKLAAELGASATFVPADLSDGAAVPGLWAQALAWRGRIDVLVNNAGIFEPADVGDDFEDWARAWHRTLAICLLAPAHLCREAIRTYRDQGGGIIVNMASRAAFRGDDADYAHYAAAKGGIVAMTRSFARALGRENILLFDIAPGFVRTSFNRAYFDTYGEAAAADTNPLGEMAEPEDIARVILMLATGTIRQATGQTIHLNGASHVH